MAAKKSTEGVKITGAVRHGGKVYVPGQEEELAKALKADGVESVRGFGVDSTDASTRPVRNDSKRAEIAARAQQARDEAQGKKGAAAGAEDDTDYASVPLADLAGALEAVNDKKTLQSLKRRDKRSGSKPIYAARLEALQSAAGDSGETDAPDDGTEEE